MGTEKLHEKAAHGAAKTIAGAAGAVTRGARKTRQVLDPTDLHGPSPDPATNLAIADIALRGGSVLARRAVERALLGKKYSDGNARSILKGRSLGETMLHGVLARVALRSVPGAIIVGGGLVAKTLYDRSKAGRARRRGRLQLQAMEQEGEDG